MKVTKVMISCQLNRKSSNQTKVVRLRNPSKLPKDRWDQSPKIILERFKVI